MSEDTFVVEPAELPGELPEDSPVVIPQVEGESELPVSETPASESAAERVRRRIREGAGAVGKRSRSSGPSATSTPRQHVPPKPRSGSLVKPLTRLYTSVGVTLMPFDPVCATAILNNAEECAKALEALAQENEAVRRAILALTATSAWGGLLIAHLPIILMVVVHHAPENVAQSAEPLARMLNSDAFRNAEPQEPEESPDAA